MRCQRFSFMINRYYAFNKVKLLFYLCNLSLFPHLFLLISSNVPLKISACLSWETGRHRHLPTSAGSHVWWDSMCWQWGSRQTPWRRISALDEVVFWWQEDSSWVPGTRLGRTRGQKHRHTVIKCTLVQSSQGTCTHNVPLDSPISFRGSSFVSYYTACI